MFKKIKKTKEEDLEQRSLALFKQAAKSKSGMALTGTDVILYIAKKLGFEKKDLI